jgi:PAS domain S-box-containing protein
MRVLVLQKPKPWLGYGSAVLLSLLAQFCRIPLHPPTTMPFITYIPFMLVAAWYSGFGPGILASALCILEAIYFAVDPVGSFAISNPQHLVGLSILALIGFISAALFENLRVAYRSELSALQRFDDLRNHQAEIVESSDDAILSKRLDGTILSWNRAAERIFGYSAEEVIGNLVLRIIPPELHAEELSIASQIQLGQKVEPFNTVRMHKDGRRVPISLSISPIRNAQGEVIGASKIARDISAQRQAEAQFRSIVEGAPNAMLAANREGRIVLVNRKTEELFGYERMGLLGKDLELLISLRYRSMYAGLLATSFEHPETRHVGELPEVFGLRSDGSELPLEVGLNVVQEAGGPLCIFSIIDITRRKQSEAQFRSIVEGAPNAMLVANREGRIVLVNRKTEELFGYTREELFIQSIEMLMPLRYREQHPAKVRNFFENPRNRSIDAKGDLYGQRKDGSEFPLELGLAYIQEGEQTLALASVIEISKRKELENELAGKIDELARSNRDLERFAYLASHDLQEPLRAVSGCLQLLEQRYRGQLDEPAGEWIGHAVDGAARMRVLIEALLSYSLVSKGGNPLQPVDCNAALEMALRNLSVSIKESGVEISREPLPMVAGIPSYLDMLFQNLIGNAIKFRRLDLPAKVRIGAELKEGYWVISISDNGIGIEEQYFERIFNLFQRLHSRSEYPGTGIGLALCKRIAEQHGGKITVTSTPGQGSCFSFTLRPLAQS